MSQKNTNSYTTDFKERAFKPAIETDQPTVHTAKELSVEASKLLTYLDKHQRLNCTLKVGH
ncbi:hypothetical protein [Vreelandella salicampi]|uniref:Transposase n=1 Tax=Vreelandella salicampi TaxID=1449798 RepID=A0A7Z0LP99_9GAMM|nr:hypothetical protein [Halomonas salicampi]NYS62566.1 hypothetical protein [Halomonas salicampi]